MTERELKKLSRTELLELLIAQMKENERLQQELEEMELRLEDRRIGLDTVGSIAEAALKVNGFFEAAEAAAAQYLENIQGIYQYTLERSEAAERKAQELVDRAWQEAESIVEDARYEAQRLRGAVYGSEY